MKSATVLLLALLLGGAAFQAAAQRDPGPPGNPTRGPCECMREWLQAAGAGVAASDAVSAALLDY